MHPNPIATNINLCRWGRAFIQCTYVLERTICVTLSCLHCIMLVIVWGWRNILFRKKGERRIHHDDCFGCACIGACVYLSLYGCCARMRWTFWSVWEEGKVGRFLFKKRYKAICQTFPFRNPASTVDSWDVSDSRRCFAARGTFTCLQIRVRFVILGWVKKEGRKKRKEICIYLQTSI